MDADEREILDYLKSYRGQFVSGREIARRAGGKWRFRENPNWSVPILRRLVERGLAETDSCGHYRAILQEKKKKEKKKWLSPEIRKLLEESGKKFGETVDIDEDQT